jgi:hypothetical protein
VQLRSSAAEFGSIDVDSLEELLIQQGLLDNYWIQMSQIYTTRAFERKLEATGDDNAAQKSTSKRRFSRKK